MDKKKYIIWTDTGSHFRCGEFLHFLFVELAQLQINVSFNLFCEKHGKNSRDQHFSRVSQFLYQESMVSQIVSSQDICNAIEKHQLITNSNNSRINDLKKNSTELIKLIQTKAFVVPQHSNGTFNRPTLNIDSLKKYYNFFNDALFVLKSHFMSDQENYTDLIYTIKDKTFTTNIPSVKKVQPIIIKSDSFRVKMMRWKLAQRIDTNYISDSSSLNEAKKDSLPDYKYCKAKCKGCKESCLFKLSELKREIPIRLIDITAELKKHGHPASRKSMGKSSGKNRSLEEAKSELKNHYIEFHTLK